ncbi:hypothetical protein Poli38472_006705 [Pythium oligandrum]|uniref:Uncharacterized protein n=1 Tax=Pythium oligandrum TaxID=41045 RepID=A0A8K1C5A0_PYTOL|nr:hypothetical protein Poli38472_006705 [Pythium oligandrum]|eukprot:TMW56695.1 hypothetical protein Poli38472_006705 [Pythium oligandrum]
MPTQACASDASYGASRAQKAAQIDQKLRCRPSQEDLIQRGILQIGGRLCRCTHEEVSKGSLQWVVRSTWPADHDLLVTQIEEGLGFSIFVTPCSYVRLYQRDFEWL